MAYLIGPEWEAVSDLTKIRIGDFVSLQNAGRAGDLLEIIISTDKPLESDRGHVIRSLDPMFRVQGQDKEIWIRYIRYDLNCTITPEPQRRCLANISDSDSIDQTSALHIETFLVEMGATINQVLSDLNQSNQDVAKQIKLLNMRYEEATETHIQESDVNG